MIFVIKGFNKEIKGERKKKWGRIEVKSEKKGMIIEKKRMVEGKGKESRSRRGSCWRKEVKRIIRVI